MVALLFDLGEEGLAFAEFVAWREGIGHQIGESAAVRVDIELGEAFGGFVRQNGQEADQGAIDGLGGEAKDSVEARGLGGVLAREKGAVASM